MELKSIKEEKNTLLLEVGNESKNFVNLLRKELWNDKDISEAAVIKEHPYMAQPKIYVKMKGKSDPKVALKKTAKNLEVQIKDLKNEFERDLSK